MHIQAYLYSMPLTSHCRGLKVNWKAWLASSLMCTTDSLCDLDVYDSICIMPAGEVHEYDMYEYLC